MNLKAIRLTCESIKQDDTTPIWFPSHSVGRCNLESGNSYPDDYFKKFEAYKETKMGKRINDFRIGFVGIHHTGKLIDIGIGCGHFMDSRPNTYGYDVSDYGIKILKEKDRYIDPYKDDVEAITCWDSFEHIPDCWKLVERVKKYVFMTVPLVFSAEHMLKSKHFKPKEHCWYFTFDGIVKCFKELGFEKVGESKAEVEFGREEVQSFAFKRS